MRGQRAVESVRRCWALCLLVSLILLVTVNVLLKLGDVKISRRAISNSPLLPVSANSVQASNKTHSQVQLVNGRTRCEGRVEVRHNDTWGTVCDDDWDMVDANVVCRQLDCGLAEAVGSSSRFGQGSGPILLDNVDCRGVETELGQCGSLGWGVHNCYHYEDVAVTCKGTAVPHSRGEPTTPSKRNSGLRDGTIRLASGQDFCQGRVEVFYQGSWGTVCDDDWGDSDAEVVCQQIGCGHFVAAHTNAFFGYGTGRILLDNVNCHGNEPQLSKCYSLGWEMHNCGHHEDAGVTCSGSGRSSSTVPLLNTETIGGRSFFQTASTQQATDGTMAVTETTAVSTTAVMTTRERQTIRVVNGNSSCKGRVEVFHNNLWGTVCDDDWDMTDALVVCRQLGCGPPVSARGLAYFGYGSGPTLLDNVDCAGSERDLADCFHLGWGQHNCGHHEDAGVICELFQHSIPRTFEFGATETIPTTRPPSAGALRLAGGVHRCEGRVEMFSGSGWGTVCDDAWDYPDAQVVCRQMLCGEATAARSQAFFGPGTGVILLDNLKCSGAEPSLQECSHISWPVHNCDHSEDAGVTCSLS